MIGAIAGDMIGSVYEFHNHRSEQFPLFSGSSFFTDDTVLTIAVADWILTSKPLSALLKEYTKRYPHRGYGGNFYQWVKSTSSLPYNSLGNGAAMRVSPVGFAFDDLETVLSQARVSAEVTHNHPEGVKGAQATAAAIFLARQGEEKARIKTYVEENFDYDLSRTIENIRPIYHFDETCPGSVPEAIIAFLESTCFEDAVRKAVSLGGDSDTIACITGGIAQAYYHGVPDFIQAEVYSRLDEHLAGVVNEFQAKYPSSR